jgi:hypothetical protein
VLFKKGNAELPENYRPISILPILYKLFTKVLCNRVKNVLLREQSVDQAGFRPGFGCEDHLFAINYIAEVSREWQIPVWIAVVDYQKAFDTISHASIWESLNQQFVHKKYINVLQRLYKGQVGTVCCDKSSRKFDIARGTKQGDPISPILFNASLEKVIRNVKVQWRRKKYGIQVGSGGERLTNLRFADDLMLIGRSRVQITRMLETLADESRKIGLEIHMGKTKILYNGCGRQGGPVPGCVEVAGKKIDVLGDDESTCYLGKLLNLQEAQDTEIQHRIVRAWAKFAVFRTELTEWRYPLKARWRLFDAVVSSSLLYASGSWTMTKEREDLLRGAQRKMLRAILGRGRRRLSGRDGLDEGEVESWVDWVKRTTGEAELLYKESGGMDWVREQQRRKWQWAGHIARRSDGRWTRKVLDWEPDGVRRKGRPCTRWEDILRKFFEASLGEDLPGDFWKFQALDRDIWKGIEEDFVEYCRRC